MRYATKAYGHGVLVLPASTLRGPLQAIPAPVRGLWSLKPTGNDIPFCFARQVRQADSPAAAAAEGTTAPPATMNVPTTDTTGTLIFKEAMEREKKSLVQWEYKYGPLSGASMNPVAQPGRLYLELQRGRNFAPLDTDGLCDSYVMMRIGQGEAKRSRTLRSLDPVWNEPFQFDCTRSDVLQVAVYDDDSMRKVKVPDYSDLQGKAQLKLAQLKPNKHQSQTIALNGGTGAPTLTITLLWRAKEALAFSAHEAQLRSSLTQMRQELALSRATAAQWENSSGYLRSFGVIAPAEARHGSLLGPAAAPVFKDELPPPGSPKRWGVIPVEDMAPAPEVAEAVGKALGHADFTVVPSADQSTGQDLVVGPRRHAESYKTFQDKWKAVDEEVQGRHLQRKDKYPVAPDGTTLPCLFGGHKRRMNRYF